jgi:hypothetical protein
MVLLRRAAFAGLAWLTAVMTLVAGMPHFECRCPNGHVKPFCLGLDSNKSGCCCGCACCSASPKGRCCCKGRGASPSKRKEKSCCHTQHRNNLASRPGPAGSPAAQSSRCVKTVAVADQFTLVNHEIPKDSQVQVAGFASPFILASCQTSGAPKDLSQAHSPAPPPDLVTVLQRLVI